ncbi:MAG: sigma-70 family RNA polymerase sigma factor [Bacteroidaceae bacterium]|nr:sigma-70 family RNA polymerase sigma factor [Bacteroidaceae bacterium]MBP5523782.1 sigma-70 family RNA polymerase sigma factor [Bacteroidaceae bacterium]MBQ4380968.1 sigma-70 family RNA polymerase sigma factor [Bacteroidaceae bacterium]
MKNLNAATDEMLVDMYIKGNDIAFDVLMKRYESKVYSYIYYSVKNQELAEDLFQDVFVKIVVRLRSGQYQESGKFYSWVMRVAHNLIIDHFRKTNDDKVVSNDEGEQDLFNDPSLAVNENREQEMIKEQMISDIKVLITKLPESQRQVLLMRYYEDMSFKEIAQKTNCSINTALGRMRYALLNLKKMSRSIA